jgi:uncharacterized membrane protein (Fun14 family)
VLPRCYRKQAAIIVGLFIAALAYLERQRILNVDWHKVHALTHISGTIRTSHPAGFKPGPRIDKHC